jgi:hypothetical protein
VKNVVTVFSLSCFAFSFKKAKQMSVIAILSLVATFCKGQRPSPTAPPTPVQNNVRAVFAAFRELQAGFEIYTSQRFTHRRMCEWLCAGTE